MGKEFSVRGGSESRPLCLHNFVAKRYDNFHLQNKHISIQAVAKVATGLLGMHSCMVG